MRKRVICFILSAIMLLSFSSYASYTDEISEASVQLMSASTGNAILYDLKINGNTIEGFSPYRTHYYYIKKPNEIVDASSLVAVAADDGAVVSEVTENVTEKGSDYSFSVTSADNTVSEFVVKVREKLPAVDDKAQYAPLTAYKRLNATGGEYATVEKSGGKDFTFAVSFKSNYYDVVANGMLYGALQFDLSGISGINNRIVLNLDTSINNVNSIGYIGAYAINGEEKILTDDVAKTYTPDNFGYEIGRAIVDGKDDDGYTTAADVNRYGVSRIDVTDYIRERIENGYTTATILLRALKYNSAGETAVRVYYGTHNSSHKRASLNFIPSEVEVASLKIGGKTVPVSGGQYTYIVSGLKKGTVPVLETIVNPGVSVKEEYVPKVPGIATVTVTDDTTGHERTYKINMLDDSYKGETTPYFFGACTSLDAYGGAEENTFKNYTSTNTNLAFRNLAAHVRQEAYVSFDIQNLLGINPSDKLSLKLNITASGDVVGSTLQVTGVVGESWKYYDGSYEIPFTDDNFVYEPVEKIAASSFFSIDVADYVTSLIERGERTATFIVRAKFDGKQRQFGYVAMGDGVKPSLVAEEVSTYATDIKVDGVTISGFDKNKSAYTAYIPDDYVGIPEITCTKADNLANEYIELPDAIPGTALVEISNPAGKTTTYEIKLRYENSKSNPTTFVYAPYVTYKDGNTGNALTVLSSGVNVKAELNLKSLKSESDITFVTALYNDGFLIKKVSSEKQGNESTLVNSIDVNLSDVSKATVKSFILSNYREGRNIINCAQLNSPDNFIKSVLIKGTGFDIFDKDILDYNINLPASVLNYPDIKVVSQDSGARLESVVPVYLPGSVTLNAIAGNGDRRTYNINFNRAEAEITNVTMDYDKLDGVNKKINIIKNIAKPVYNPIPSKPPVAGSSSGADFNKEYALANCTNPINFLTDRSNIWLADMDDRFCGAQMIAVPFDGINPAVNGAMNNYRTSTGFINFDINRSATVYVLHSATPMPSWASSEGFAPVADLTDNKLFLSNSDGSVTMTNMPYAYSKYYSVKEWSEEPVTVSLGSIASHNYWWIIVVFDK